MNLCLDNDDISEGNNSDGNNSIRSKGPPRKKTKATIVVNDNVHFSLPEPGSDADNEGLSSRLLLMLTIILFPIQIYKLLRTKDL